MSLNINWEPECKYFVFHEYEKSKVKMHTKKLDERNWVKIDETYMKQMAVKIKLIKEKRDHVFMTQESEHTDNCKRELFEHMIEYLPKRYPDIFDVTNNFLVNKALGTKTNVNGGDDPLIKLGENLQEDWIILEWCETKQAYVLTAGLLCFPTGWHLHEKFGNVLSDIHNPVIPFKKYLEQKVSSLLKTMKPTTGFWRANWGIHNDLDGIYDLFTPPPGKDIVSVFNPLTTGHDLILRIEYQTLRKLPKTKCIVFSIRIYQMYLEQFKKFPAEDAKGLSNAIRSLDEDFFKYKQAPRWSDAALKYLDMVYNEKQTQRNGSNVITLSLYFGITALFLGIYLK